MRRAVLTAGPPASVAGVAFGAGALLVVMPSIAAVAVGAVALVVLLHFGRAAVFAAAAICATIVSGFVASRGLSSASRWSDVVALLVIAAAAASLRQRIREGSQVRLAARLPTVLLLAFLALVLFHVGLAVLGGDARRAWLGARSWCFLPVTFFIGRRIASQRSALSTLVVGVCIGALLTLAYGYKQFFLGYTPSERALINLNANSVFYQGVPRLSATLPTNQDFAAFLIIALPAAMAFAGFVRGGRLARWTCIVLPVAASGLAVLGMVRSAAIAAAAGSLVVIALASRERQRRAIALVLSLLIAAFVVQVAIATTGTQGGAVRSRLATLTKLAGDPALNARLRVEWPRVAHAIEQRPLGHGVATTGGPAIKLSGAASAVIPDNGYLTLGYEVGIPGVLLYVGFLVAAGAAAARAVRTRVDPLERATALAAVGAVASVLVAMVGASYVQLPTLQILLFTLLGAATRLDETA